MKITIKQLKTLIESEKKTTLQEAPPKAPKLNKPKKELSDKAFDVHMGIDLMRDELDALDRLVDNNEKMAAVGLVAEIEDLTYSIKEAVDIWLESLEPSPDFANR